MAVIFPLISPKGLSAIYLETLGKGKYPHILRHIGDLLPLLKLLEGQYFGEQQNIPGKNYILHLALFNHYHHQS